MKKKDFEKLIIDTLAELPGFFIRKMKNVDVVIENEPTPKQVKTHRQSVLGLYQGVPLSERTHLYGLVLPDKITIFKRNIERVCKTDEEIKKLVSDTVKHELAHHFGISDERLTDLGVY